MKRKWDKEKRDTSSLEKKHTSVFGQNCKVAIALMSFTLRIQQRQQR